VLAALLFIIYINDLKKICSHIEINFFADDTLLYVAANNVKEAESIMQEEMARIYEWLCRNKLKLNASKTKMMILTNKKNVNKDEIKIEIENDKIERVSTIKYLGIMIDDRLNMHENVQFLCKKIAKKINYLARLGNKVNDYNKVTIYNAIVAPHFEYCSSMMLLCTNDDLVKLQKLQNRAMRIILRVGRRTRINDMLVTLNWMCIKQRIVFNSLLLIHKMRMNAVPQYLCKKLQYVRDVHNRELRNMNDLRPIDVRKSSTRRMLLYRGVHWYNELNENVKQEMNFESFRRQCTEFVKIKFGYNSIL
jgi:hypothetical protein